MRATSRARVLVLAAVPALLLATGCLPDDDPKAAPSFAASSPAVTSDPEPGKSTTPVPSRAPATTRPASGGLTAEQLRAAMVGGDDLGPTMTVATADGPYEPKDMDEDCRPVMDLVEGGAGRPGAGARQLYTVSDERAADALPVVVGMTSFRAGEADRLLREGEAALARCSTFTAETDGTMATYEATRTQMSSYGDRSVAVQLTTRAEGAEIVTGYVVVRTGDVVSVYVAVGATGGPVDFPDSKLITIQTRRLEAALAAN